MFLEFQNGFEARKYKTVRTSALHNMYTEKKFYLSGTRPIIISIAFMTYKKLKKSIDFTTYKYTKKCSYKVKLCWLND